MTMTMTMRHNIIILTPAKTIQDDLGDVGEEDQNHLGDDGDADDQDDLGDK